MKTSFAVASVAVVTLVTVVAATFRVTTAPDRLRMRLDSARTSCLNNGGEWIKVGREELCRTAGDRKKI